MSRSVQAFLPVIGDADRLVQEFLRDPGEWLPDARREGPQQWKLPVFAGALSRVVSVHVGTAWQSGATTWRTLAWDPEPDDSDAFTIDRFLPSLDAEIGLARPNDAVKTLIVDGRYAPPGGPFGQALDAVAMHRVARATVERFAADIAARLNENVRRDAPVSTTAPGQPERPT